jgi:anaerobic selenocysteine-containing dehydrogenase
MNQPHGFDCPGCAWPDPKHTSSFEFCENGAKAVTWEATAKRTTPEFFAAHTVRELWNWPDFDLENEGRLTHPMAYDRATDRYLPISCDEALSKIGAALHELPHPDMAEFYTSGRAANEAAFLYQLFAGEYGTNNFRTCATRPAASVCPNQSASAKELWRWRTSITPTRCFTSATIPGPTIRAC